MRIARGITRNVILTDRYAFKFPTFRSWSLFLRGLLANMQEHFWWNATHDRRLCPVLFGVWGGWFIVMARAACLQEGVEPNYEEFDGLPLDPKPTNFGIYADEIVLVDYGS